jgi:tellurite resistance protein TerC
LQIEPWVWLLTVGVLSLVIIGDLIFQIRRPHEPTFRESAIQSIIYVSLGVLFTFVIWAFWGGQYGSEYIAGFITEKSLSVDNLFVFLIIFTQFQVPRRLQSQALLVGIVIALIMRGLFIAAGAAIIETFSWAFYIFGAFLIWTAVKLMVETLGSKSEEAHVQGEGLVGFIKRRFPTTDEYHGTRLTIVKNGRRLLTPLFLVMVAIGFTDLLFALDSIPAIYGLTKEPYLVFAANAFALLGLRQLYFLLSGLMERLKYLGVGLSIILGWIGVKLVIHAMHKNELPFINGGEHITWVPEISTELSLGVILVTLVVTTVWSLRATKGQDAKATKSSQG